MRKHKKVVPGSNVLPLNACVIYIRVSTRQQADSGYSLDAQLKFAKDYAAKRLMPVVGIFIDIESAKQAGRAQFEEMLKFLRTHSGEMPAVICEQSDRLYRNFQDKVTLEKLGVCRHFIKEHLVMSPKSNSKDKLTHNIGVSLATHYSDNLSEETKKGMKEKAAQGMWPSVAPVGYLNVLADDGKKCIVPDPKYAPMIRQVFEWYGAGGVSLTELTERLAAAAYLSPYNGKPFPRATVHNILRCMTYSGNFMWADEFHNGKYKAIVSPELWDHCKRMLEMRATCHEKPTKHDFAYAGKICCGHTGRLFTGDIKKGGLYTYYSPGRYTGPGKKPYVREDVLDCRVGEVLRQLEFGEDVLSGVARILKSSHEEQRKFHEGQIARHQAEYTKIDGFASQMYRDKLEGVISAEQYVATSNQYKVEQEKLLKAIQDHQTATGAYYDDGIKLLELARKAHELFLKQPAVERRKLLNLLCSNCTWKDGELTVVLQEPYETLRVTNVALKAMEATEPSFSGSRPDWLRGLDSNQQPVD